MFPTPVESMPQIIKAVLKAKGGPTRYYLGVPNKEASECVYISDARMAVISAGAADDPRGRWVG